MSCTTDETKELEGQAPPAPVTAPVLWFQHFMTRNGMNAGGLVYNI